MTSVVDRLEARVFACPDENGGTVFQDRACAAARPDVAPARSSDHRLPAGMHGSWFERPAHIDERAYCDERACSCGGYRQEHDGSLEYAVADAMYLDGHWHRYNSAVLQWQDRDAGAGASSARRANPKSGAEVRRELIESGCEVLISQTLLRQYAEQTLDSMRQLARTAEAHGDESPAACEPIEGEFFEEIDTVRCQRFQDLRLYRQMVRDASALRLPRGSSVKPW